MDYKENGYHLEKGLFRDEVKLLLDEFEPLIGNDEQAIDLFAQNPDEFVSRANVCQRSLSLYTVATSDKMKTMLEHLGLVRPIINTRPLLSFSHPNTARNKMYWAIPAHQDWPSTQGSLNGLTCWVALVDVPAELGPLEIAPKSHLNGPLNHVERHGVPVADWEGDFESIKMEQGDAIFFSYFTIHRSGINTSNKIRRSAHFRFDDAEEPTFVERGRPWNRKDNRVSKILHPGVPSQEQIARWFRTS